MGGIHFASNNNDDVDDSKKSALIRRNVSVIAHVDHGKSTIMDSLVQMSGALKESATGEARVMDSTEQEQRRGITISASAISFDFENVFNKISNSNQCEMHISNLPFDTTKEQLVKVLNIPGKQQVEWIQLHAKRGYAYASLIMCDSIFWCVCLL